MAKAYKDPDKIPIEQLIKLDTNYAIRFDHSPVGLKHCVTKTKSILLDNNLLFNSPDVNDELNASYVNGIEDYENLNLSINTGGSEVRKGWILSNGWHIALMADKAFYSILFFKNT